MPKPYIGYNNPSSPQTLQALNAAGDTLSDLVADSVGSTQTGDLIELGFFDTDSGATITPNTDTTNLFHGIWTPITSKTTIGQDYSAAKTVGAGLFGFETRFDARDGGANADPGYSDTAMINEGSSGTSYEITNDTPANLYDNIQALEGATNLFSEFDFTIREWVPKRIVLAPPVITPL